MLAFLVRLVARATILSGPGDREGTRPGKTTVVSGNGKWETCCPTSTQYSLFPCHTCRLHGGSETCTIPALRGHQTNLSGVNSRGRNFSSVLTCIDKQGNKTIPIRYPKPSHWPNGEQHTKKEGVNTAQPLLSPRAQSPKRQRRAPWEAGCR
jgi:hypothetical protein